MIGVPRATRPQLPHGRPRKTRRSRRRALPLLSVTSYLVNNMVMSKANIFDVKARFSAFVDRAAAGERILICRRNKPVAELGPVAEVRTEPRPIGPLPGRTSFDLPASFFEPLPPDELDLWEGRGVEAGPGFQAAERKTGYGAGRRRKTRSRS